MNLEYSYHPVIAGLKVAEDGSKVFLNGELLKPHTVKRINQTRVSISGRKISIAKLVLECFEGLRPSLNHRCVMIDKTLGIHYTNLMWEENYKSTIYSSRKLTDDQEEEITRRHESGEATRKELAAEFGLKNHNTITAIKKRVNKRRKK